MERTRRRRGEDSLFMVVTALRFMLDVDALLMSIEISERPHWGS